MFFVVYLKSKTDLLFFGYPVDNVIIKNGGVKSLSSPGEAYVNNKIVLTMKDRENGNFYILIPEYFLAAIFRFCGVIFDGASDIEKPLIPISGELESLDLSILHSNNRLFVKYYTLMRRIENEGELSSLLTSLLESGFIDYNHLASLRCFYSDFDGMLEKLSKNTLGITNRLYDDIKHIVRSNEKAAAAWKGIIDYQFHNVISRLVFSGNFNAAEVFTSDSLLFIDSEICSARAAFIEKYFPYGEAFEFFVKKDNSAFFITAEMRNLLIDLAALGFKADYDLLFKKFGPEFKNSFNDDLRKRKLSLEKTGSEKLKALATESMISFREKTGAYILDSVVRRRAPMGLKALYERVGSLGREGVIILYNRTGYEKFASLFDVFRFSRYSPLEREEADSFFEGVSAMLPYIERNICRDIYFERINRDRVINDNAHDRAIRDVSHALMFMDEIKFTEARNDQKIDI